MKSEVHPELFDARNLRDFLKGILLLSTPANRLEDGEKIHEVFLRITFFNPIL